VVAGLLISFGLLQIQWGIALLSLLIVLYVAIGRITSFLKSKYLQNVQTLQDKKLEIIEELKSSSNYNKIKSLIDTYSPATKAQHLSQAGYSISRQQAVQQIPSKSTPILTRMSQQPMLQQPIQSTPKSKLSQKNTPKYTATKVKPVLPPKASPVKQLPAEVSPVHNRRVSMTEPVQPVHTPIRKLQASPVATTPVQNPQIQSLPEIQPILLKTQTIAPQVTPQNTRRRKLHEPHILKKAKSMGMKSDSSLDQDEGTNV
jgi:hypothetical protein